MKKRLIIVLLLMTICAIGLLIYSTISNKNKEVYTNQVLKIKLNQTVVVKNADNMRITLDSVSDMRSDEYHGVWAGEIVYKLKVDSTTVELKTVTNRIEEYNDYKLVLDDNKSTNYVNLIVEK